MVLLKKEFRCLYDNDGGCIKYGFNDPKTLAKYGKQEGCALHIAYRLGEGGITLADKVTDRALLPDGQIDIAVLAQTLGHTVVTADTTNDGVDFINYQIKKSTSTATLAKRIYNGNDYALLVRGLGADEVIIIDGDCKAYKFPRKALRWAYNGRTYEVVVVD